MDGLVVDLDGTVYLGESLIPGVDEALGRLRAAGFGVVFATNKSVARPKDYVDKLTHLGVQATEADLVTVNAVLARHLAERLSPTDRVLAVGEAPLFEELAAAGLHTTTDWSEAAAVAMGWDRTFDYPTLDAVFQAARRGAYVAATNPDVTCPMENGEVPDCGMQIAALEAGIGRSIDIVVGKPAATMAQAAMDRLGLTPRQCWMIGDRVSTDMRMAHEAGMRSALVLTGVTTREQAIGSPWEPDLVCRSLVEFANHVL